MSDGNNNGVLQNYHWLLHLNVLHVTLRNTIYYNVTLYFYKPEVNQSLLLLLQEVHLVNSHVTRQVNIGNTIFAKFNFKFN